MAKILIAEGSVWNIKQLALYDEEFQPGDLGEIRLHLRLPVPQRVLNIVSEKLAESSVPLWDTPKQVGNTLYIRFFRPEAEVGKIAIAWVPLAVIVAALSAAFVAAAIVLVVILIGWGLYKVTEKGGAIAWWIWGLVVVGGALVVYQVVKKTPELIREVRPITERRLSKWL